MAPTYYSTRRALQKNRNTLIFLNLRISDFFSGFWIRGSLDESQEVELEGPLLLASTQEGVTNSQEEPKQTKEIILEPIEHTTLLLSSVEYQTESYQLEDLFSEDNDQSN